MSESSQRYLFIDLLRFVAGFFMIQGHVFDAVLSPAVKAHPLYYLHDFFHGFVAPAFLFSSGVAYGVSTLRRWEDHVVWGPRTQRRLGRFLGLIAIGYALHLPYFSLRKTLSEASPSEIRNFLQSDVLQCVGVTLLLLQLGVLLLRNKRVFQYAVAGTAFLIIFAAPFLWSGHLEGMLPLALVSYLTPELGSWFPLFPWSAYLLCGVLFGSLFVGTRSTEGALGVSLRAVAVSVGILLVSWATMYLPFDLYPAHDFWKSNPAMFFVRLSVIGIAANGIYLAEYWSGIAPRIPLVLGRESLFIYILHLLIVYGSVVNRGLSQQLGHSLEARQALEVFALVFAGVALVTLLWYKLKTEHSRIAASLTFGGAALFLIQFVRRPW